jgi:very-short-patch-repair endonuclease
MRGADSRTVRRERRLRRQLTDAERRLWFELRDRRLGGFKFVRQEAIGRYIADFVCREKKLIIEADGRSACGECARPHAGFESGSTGI